MPRSARLLLEDRSSVYHVMSRTALDGFPFQDAEKDRLLNIIKYFSTIYFCDILGFALMGNHFHILIRFSSVREIQHSDIIDRFRIRYGLDTHPSAAQIDALGRKWTSLSEFMREVKQTFSRYYNKRHDRRGTLWGERFKSVLVENGQTLVNCLAYIDLNPVRAGLVRRPEEYRWCSLGYHLQTDNRDDFLSLDFGLIDWNIDDTGERRRLYRQFLYETGALDSPKGPSLNPEIIEGARKSDYEYTKADRFRLRTRWFTDSGIIGSKSFIRHVAKLLNLPGATKRSPKNITGLDMCALKRLTEVL